MDEFKSSKSKPITGNGLHHRKSRIVPSPIMLNAVRIFNQQMPSPIQSPFDTTETNHPALPTASVTPPTPNHLTTKPLRQIYCFQFSELRRRIITDNAFESTVEPRQRQSYPYLYIHANNFNEALEKVSAANEDLSEVIYDCDYSEFQEQLAAVLHRYNGYVHDDDIAADVPPPQKNITALRRKRSRKSPAKHSQLNLLIKHEEVKRRTPTKTTELDRCHNQHQPIVYVAPPEHYYNNCIDKYDGNGGIRLNRLAIELALAAMSVLDMPPVETEVEVWQPIEQTPAMKYRAELSRANELFQKQLEIEAKHFSLQSPGTILSEVLNILK